MRWCGRQSHRSVSHRLDEKGTDGKVGADWTRSECGLARLQKPQSDHLDTAGPCRSTTLCHHLQELTAAYCVHRLPLRHFYQRAIDREELSRSHLLPSPPSLTTPGDHLRLRLAAGCRSCKPQHVPPHSNILTCHLILRIPLTPLLRAYTYVLIV
jgi:hypothetical protein